MKAWIERHPVASYYLVAYACSWSIVVPLALQAQGMTNTQLPFSLHYLSAFGPAIAAVALAALFGERLAGGAQTRFPTERSRQAGWSPYVAVFPTLIWIVIVSMSMVRKREAVTATPVLPVKSAA